MLYRLIESITGDHRVSDESSDHHINNELSDHSISGDESSDSEGVLTIVTGIAMHI